MPFHAQNIRAHWSARDAAPSPLRNSCPAGYSRTGLLFEHRTAPGDLRRSVRTRHRVGAVARPQIRGRA